MIFTTDRAVYEPGDLMEVCNCTPRKAEEKHPLHRVVREATFEEYCADPTPTTQAFIKEQGVEVLRDVIKKYPRLFYLVETEPVGYIPTGNLITVEQYIKNREKKAN